MRRSWLMMGFVCLVLPIHFVRGTDVLATGVPSIEVIGPNVVTFKGDHAAVTNMQSPEHFDESWSITGRLENCKGFIPAQVAVSCSKSGNVFVDPSLDCQTQGTGTCDEIPDGIRSRTSAAGAEGAFSDEDISSCTATCSPSPPPPPLCNCIYDSDCLVYPAPEGGRWQCRLCRCVATESPLVIHLPDYLSSKFGNQNWWKEGFCTAEAPTVCLDWRGDGRLTCTAWTTPTSEVAFVVALRDHDMLDLADGVPVLAEPWRHFFGNVTMGSEGDFPFANGFEALAARCNQDLDASRLDLTECGHSLFAWADRSGDGVISPDELVEFPYLGIESLGGVRKTGKTDKCGNTFAFESHATCADRPGRCGTWLDAFFEPR